MIRSLSRFAVIFKRELAAYFYSSAAYLVMFVFLAVNAFVLLFYQGRTTDLARDYFNDLAFWSLLVLLPPLFTMRSFADELRTGSYDQLIATGTGEPTLFVGKFAAAWIYQLSLWAGLFPLLVWLGPEVSNGTLIACAVGLAATTGLFTALGLCASAMTESAVVACGTAMILNLGCLLIYYLRGLFAEGSLGQHYVDYLSVYTHFRSDFVYGVVDGRYFGLYATSALAAGFVAVKLLERRRWW